jgi:hypothetical protein
MMRQKLGEDLEAAIQICGLDNPLPCIKELDQHSKIKCSDVGILEEFVPKSIKCSLASELQVRNVKLKINELS